MKLDGFGIFVENMEVMVNFYKGILGFEIKWEKGQNNVFLEKYGTLFLLYGRNDFEEMTKQKYNYALGINGHFEITLSVESYTDVDKEYNRLINLGVKSIMAPTTEPWGQRTCYIADPEGNLIEIGSFDN